jgi:hypothetical protein
MRGRCYNDLVMPGESAQQQPQLLEQLERARQLFLDRRTAQGAAFPVSGGIGISGVAAVPEPSARSG